LSFLLIVKSLISQSFLPMAFYHNSFRIAISNDIIADTSSMPTRQVTEIKNQLSEAIKQLSPERLKVLADFAAFLANAESEAATQELLSISGLLERVKQNQATPKSQYINWRTVRSDV
jgi:hypothetical protein